MADGMNCFAIATPGDPALAAQPLEVTDEEHSKVNSRRNARASAPLVMGFAELFHEQIKPSLSKHFVERLEKGMPRTLNQLRGGDEELNLFSPACSNRHVSMTTNSSFQFDFAPDFFNELL